MPTNFSQELEERLLRYVQIDTQSDETSTTSPSTAIQLDLLRLLRDELVALGIKDVVLTDYGAVLATLPANDAANRPRPLPFWRMWTRPQLFMRVA